MYHISHKLTELSYVNKFTYNYQQSPSDHHRLVTLIFFTPQSSNGWGPAIAPKPNQQNSIPGITGPGAASAAPPIAGGPAGAQNPPDRGLSCSLRAGENGVSIDG